jgi:hypothetical protein
MSEPIDDFKDVVEWRVLDPQAEYRTGDILLFSGSGIGSLIIKTFTASTWSHIGMVCWVEMIYKDGHKQIDLFSFELGSCDYVDLMTGLVANKRVRMVKLSSIAKMYDLIAIRKLNLPKRNSKEARAWATRFQEFAWANKQKPFFDPMTFLSIHFIEAGANTTQTTCSCLAANMLKHMHLFDSSLDNSQVNPEDFSSFKDSFPHTHGPIFKTKEIVIYKDHAKIIRRLFILSILIIMIILVVVFTVIYYYKRKKRRKAWVDANRAIPPI